MSSKREGHDAGGLVCPSGMHGMLLAHRSPNKARHHNLKRMLVRKNRVRINVAEKQMDRSDRDFPISYSFRRDGWMGWGNCAVASGKPANFERDGIFSSQIRGGGLKPFAQLVSPVGPLAHRSESVDRDCHDRERQPGSDRRRRISPLFGRSQARGNPTGLRTSLQGHQSRR